MPLRLCVLAAATSKAFRGQHEAAGTTALAAQEQAAPEVQAPGPRSSPAFAQAYGTNTLKIFGPKKDEDGKYAPRIYDADLTKHDAVVVSVNAPVDLKDGRQKLTTIDQENEKIITKGNYGAISTGTELAAASDGVVGDILSHWHGLNVLDGVRNTVVGNVWKQETGKAPAIILVVGAGVHKMYLEQHKMYLTVPNDASDPIRPNETYYTRDIKAAWRNVLQEANRGSQEASGPGAARRLASLAIGRRSAGSARLRVAVETVARHLADNLDHGLTVELYAVSQAEETELLKLAKEFAPATPEDTDTNAAAWALLLGVAVLVG